MSPATATSSTVAAPTSTARVTRPAARPVPRRAAPLTLVPKRRSSASRAPFAVVLVCLLAGGLLGLLLLNTLVAQQSFRLHDLAKQAAVLQEQEQALTRQVQTLQAPGELASRATRLGMVPGGPPAFLRLSDGKVLGKPVAGAGPVTTGRAATGRAATGRAATGRAATGRAATGHAAPASRTTAGTTPSTTTAGAAR